MDCNLVLAKELVLLATRVCRLQAHLDARSIWGVGCCGVAVQGHRFVIEYEREARFEVPVVSNAPAPLPASRLGAVSKVPVQVVQYAAVRTARDVGIFT